MDWEGLFDDVKHYGLLALALVFALVLAVLEPIGLLAVLLVQGLHLAFIGAGGRKLPKAAVSLVVLGVSLVIAYMRTNGAWPEFPVLDPAEPAAALSALFGWAQAALGHATPIVGAAMIQYNLILERVLTWLGDNVGLARLEPRGR